MVVQEAEVDREEVLWGSEECWEVLVRGDAKGVG